MPCVVDSPLICGRGTAADVFRLPGRYPCPCAAAASHLAATVSCTILNTYYTFNTFDPTPHSTHTLTDFCTRAAHAPCAPDHPACLFTGSAFYPHPPRACLPSLQPRLCPCHLFPFLPLLCLLRCRVTQRAHDLCWVARPTTQGRPSIPPASGRCRYHCVTGLLHAHTPPSHTLFGTHLLPHLPAATHLYTLQAGFTCPSHYTL